MVGVLNGKKKAVSLVVVAFLLCGVFGGLVTYQSLAGATGYAGRMVVDTSWSEGQYIICTNLTLSFPEGYCGHVTAVYAYMDFNASGSWQGGIYNSAWTLVAGSAVSNSISAGDAQWYSLPLDAYLVSGDYYIAGVSSAVGDVFINYVSSVSGQTSYYKSGSSLPSSLTGLSSWGSATPVIYVVYEYSELVSESSADVAGWGGLVVSLFLVGVSLALALKSRSWAVNFLFGLV